MRQMGLTHVKLKVSNIYDSKNFVEDQFLVDSGASYTVLPYEFVKKLGLKPLYTKSFVLADGKIVKRKVGEARIEFENTKIPTLVVLGKKNDDKILGVLTLEAMGLSIDPFERKLYKARLTL